MLHESNNRRPRAEESFRTISYRSSKTEQTQTISFIVPVEGPLVKRTILIKFKSSPETDKVKNRRRRFAQYDGVQRSPEGDPGVSQGGVNAGDPPIDAQVQRNRRS